MIFLILSFVICETCTLPNTEVNSKGQCVCKQGYLTDHENFNKNGCWLCDKACGTFAKCSYPGKCTCLKGFYGNGIVCKQSLVTINNITRINISKNGKNTVTFEYTTKESPITTMYCKFGSHTTKARIINNNSAECTTPRRIYGITELFISEDSYNWNEEKQIVDLHPYDTTKEIIEAFPFMVSLVILMLLGVVVLYGKELIFTPEKIPVVGNEDEGDLLSNSE